MKKSLIITAAALISVGLILFGCAFAAAGFDISKLSTMKVETNVYAVDEAFTDILLDTVNSNIEFKLSGDGTCRVVCTERDKMKHSVTVDNHTLTVRTVDKRAWYDYLTFSFKSLSIEVYLPEAQYHSLTVDSGTGDVVIPAGFTFGAVDIDASTGDIECAACVTGALRIDVSTGNILLSGVNAGSIRLDSSTGNVRLCSTVASGALNVDTSTGNVRFENSDASEITVSTSTGNVTGSLNSPKLFYATTSTGSVDVPDTRTGGKCTISTSTGNIDISLTAQE